MNFFIGMRGVRTPLALLLCFIMGASTCHYSNAGPLSKKPVKPSVIKTFTGLTFQLNSYDCGTGVLHYQINSTDNSTQVSITMPGIIAGTIPPNTDQTFTFPSDGKTGRNVTVNATQGSNSMNCSFTNGCGSDFTTTCPSGGGTTNPPSNPPSGSNFAFQVNSYDCGTGVLHYQINSPDNSTQVNITMPGIIAGTIPPNTDQTFTFPSDGKTGRNVTVNATQGSNSMNCSFTNGCGSDFTTNCPSGGGTTNPPSNPPSNPPTGTSYVGNLEQADCSNIGGWALDQNHNQQSIYVDIYINNSKVATVQANAPRDDVQGSFNISGNNRFGFGWIVPDQYKNGSSFNVSVKFANTNTDISSSPKTSPVCAGSNPSGGRIAAGAPVGRPLFNGDPNLLSNWKWYDSQYNVFYRSGSVMGEPAYSPFGNAGTIVQYDDQHEEDGWMLVARDFGVSQQEAAAIGIQQDGVTLPFFVLYNRYTGKLRVFIYNSSLEPEYSHHIVELSLVSTDPNPPANPALFTFNNKDSTQLFVDHYDPNIVLTALADATKRGWSIADFNLAYYDDRIFSTTMFDNFALQIKISNANLTNTSLKGDLKLDGSVEPKSFNGILDKANNISTFGIKSFDSVPKIVSAFTLGAEKGVELGSGISSAAELFNAGSDLLNGLFGDSGGYDLSVTGNVTLDGTSTLMTGGSIYQIYLKRHSPRRSGNIYDPVQDIPWGIVGVKQFSTVEVVGHYENNGQRIYTSESGHEEEIRLINYHAHGFSIVPVMRPIIGPATANPNGINLLYTQATYFHPDGTPTPHMIGFTDAKYSPPDFTGFIKPSEFQNKEFSVVA